MRLLCGLLPGWQQERRQAAPAAALVLVLAMALIPVALALHFLASGPLPPVRLLAEQEAPARGCAAPADGGDTLSLLGEGGAGREATSNIAMFALGVLSFATARKMASSELVLVGAA